MAKDDEGTTGQLDVGVVEQPTEHPSTELPDALPTPRSASADGRPRLMGDRASQPREMRQIVELLDQALGAPLHPDTRETIEKARTIADTVIDGRTVSVEPTVRRQRAAAGKGAGNGGRKAAKTPRKRAATAKKGGAKGKTGRRR